MAFQTSTAGISCSDHLKISTPSGFKTRIHSENPSWIICGQFSDNLLYFFTNHDVSFAFVKCGGSKTTKENVLSSNGRSVKSHWTSGSIIQLCSDLPFVLAHIPKCSSFLLSQYIASGCSLLNQMLLLPHVQSRIFLSVLIIFFALLSFRRFW